MTYLPPRQALNKAFLKVKPNRLGIDVSEDWLGPLKIRDVCFTESVS